MVSKLGRRLQSIAQSVSSLRREPGILCRALLSALLDRLQTALLKFAASRLHQKRA